MKGHRRDPTAAFDSIGREGITFLSYDGYFKRQEKEKKKKGGGAFAFQKPRVVDSDCKTLASF